ncbi:uncharacterized protein LOC6734066 isoform X1 [Drosophila simulans]|uniref:Uncharacterized protein, isoform B n=1 Tax=Drosophila simulans TaxID=7240 RepID=A0A0J9RBK8_DROSI|nr:uncharacterized protein LOC6734066 isoform X1 [Drosophila simulans]KMY93064.1 uncharacterized protein Dsimw501_GD10828, isoform B [Drosophila simulans]
MSSSAPGSESGLAKVSTPSPSPLAKLDADFTSSKFEMHPSLSDEERRFYLKMYPNVDLVNQRKVHCTVCKLHLGTAPAAESNIKMHPILRVTHCVKCHDFYNSGEFSKGEDGSELYCRWCGQGGEVYCCSTCPYVFCKSCIVKNLSKGVIVDIEQNENWNCFSCTSKILWPLRAQHWALVNYLQTQKRALQTLQLPEVEARRQMLKDNSNCCRLAKSKTSSLSDSMESLESNVSKRSQGSSAGSGKRGSMPKTIPPGPPSKRTKTSNNEVVCTPDLLSMLEPDCQLSVTSKPTGRQPVTAANITTTPRIVTVQQNYQPGQSSSSSGSNGSVSGSSSVPPTLSSLPPPLVLSGSGIRYRQNAPGGVSGVVRRTVVPNSVRTSGPVFHTINGFKVDLNSAAQQDSYRLPNGRLIQVKRQVPQAIQPASTLPTPQTPPALVVPQVGPGVVIRPRAPITSNRPSLHISAYGSNMGIYNPQTNQQQRAPQVRVGNTNQAPPPLQGPQPNANGGQTLMITPAPPPAPKVPTLVRHTFPNTPMGQARAQLQEQIFSAMDICTHLTGKVVSLTHSNAYNQVRSYLELKQLYIHMSYLMTYAIGRFKNLHEKCLVDMREKGFKNDANSLENGQLAADKQASDDEDNEIEIVEPKTDTITIESDNEDDMPSTSTATQQKQPQETAIMKITSVTSEAAKNELQENNQTDIDVAAFSSTILASLLEVEVNEGASEPKPTSPGQKKQPRKKTTNKPNPALLQLERQRMEDMKKSDAKLKMKVMVKLKRAEDEFEVARKWVEDMKREQELATKIKDSKAATPSNKTKNPSENLKISETGSSAKKENKKRHGEVDKENTKNKEKIGDILKAAIKAKIGENEKHMAEDEHLPVDELLTDKDKELDKEKSTSTEPEKNNTSGIEKEADKEQHSIKENIVKGESKDESKKVTKTDQKSDCKKGPDSECTEMEEDTEMVSEKEYGGSAEEQGDTENMKDDTSSESPTLIGENEKQLLKEGKEKNSEKSEKEVEPSKDVGKEFPTAQGKGPIKAEEQDTDELKDAGAEPKNSTQDALNTVEPPVEKSTSTLENDQSSVGELIERMDVTELDETPKELLACALDEVIAMEGIELGDDTEELIKALGSPSVLASENTKDNETDLDANDFIENLPLETTEPPEILLKEDEIKVEKPTGTSQVGASSPAENGDTEMESTLEASDSAPDELATAEIVG